MATYTYGKWSLVDRAAKRWRFFLWPAVVFAVACGLLLVVLGKPDLRLILALLFACVFLVVAALISGYGSQQHLQRRDIPTSLAIEESLLRLYHGESRHAEIDLADIDAVEDVGPVADALVSFGTLVKLKRPLNGGLDHFYILPDLQGYAALVGILRSALRGQTEPACDGSWALRTGGKAEYGMDLFLLVGFIGLPALVVRDMFVGAQENHVSPVFEWLMIVFGLAGSVVIAWKVAHIPASIRLNSSGVELRLLFAWRVRVERKDLRSVRHFPAAWGQPEHHRVYFGCGYFDISPTFFDRYADLVQCCQNLVGMPEG